MSHQNESIKSIFFALGANTGIAITKTIAAIFTGSGAMLAESIHSFADCANQGLLFFGLNRAKKAPNPEHPLGYGKEIYFWSFVVAIILFSMGGVFSIYEGIHKINAEEELKNPAIAITVLLISLVLEGSSLFGCIGQIKKIRGKTPFFRWVLSSRQSELIVVLGEDVAALFGLSFALTAVVLAMLTANPVYDAIGSIGIGILLLFVSIFIALKVKHLLIGQSSDLQTREEIRSFLEKRPEIDTVYNLITVQLGPQIMVAVKAGMKEAESASKMLKHINICEAELKKAIPAIQWVFFEPDNGD